MKFYQVVFFRRLVMFGFWFQSLIYMHFQLINYVIQSIKVWFLMGPYQIILYTLMQYILHISMNHVLLHIYNIAFFFALVAN